MADTRNHFLSLKKIQKYRKCPALSSVIKKCVNFSGHTAQPAAEGAAAAEGRRRQGGRRRRRRRPAEGCRCPEVDKKGEKKGRRP